MLRKDAVVALGLALGLVTFVACSGGEAGGQEAESEAAAEAPSAETPMAEGGEMQQEMELPEGVTMEMVNQGKEIYASAGLCSVCHGAEGEGGVGANLKDDEWLHSDGSYEGVVQTVMSGVDAGESSNGTPMAERGGSGITDEQVRAVAAYVWTLGRGGS